MNETRKKIYDQWREEFKDDPAKAVGWRNMEALNARFQCTLNHLSHKNFNDVRILDVGCGASLNLLRYLPDDDYIYVGIDCNKESLKYASEKYCIPFNKDIRLGEREMLLLDEDLSTVSQSKFDVILSQGIYQEFDDIKSIKKHVIALSKMLDVGGELLIMTPANRILDAEGRSVLKISAYDAVSILEDTGLPYELFLGELGEHIIMRVYRRDLV
jgi:SAM-dependent methyltransferase